jgi:multimeric flavodoxin WrbA
MAECATPRATSKEPNARGGCCLRSTVCRRARTWVVVGTSDVSPPASEVGAIPLLPTAPMLPDDSSGNLPTNARPFRIIIIAGSSRRQYNCPGIDSKARTLMLRMAEALPANWEIDYGDIGNVYKREQIRSCTACASTSMALCVWPCNCYEAGNSTEPDLMWNLDLYARLDLADAWAIVGPVNWYAPSSSLKLMFDRLVCMNGGNPDETTIGHKDPERAMALEHTPKWEAMSVNHLEGRSAAFFCYGDGGGDEMDANNRPKFSATPSILMVTRSRSRICGRPTRRWCGSVATAASKYRIGCGDTMNRDTGASTATTKRPRTIWLTQSCGGGIDASDSATLPTARHRRCSTMRN